MINNLIRNFSLVDQKKFKNYKIKEYFGSIENGKFITEA